KIQDFAYMRMLKELQELNYEVENGHENDKVSNMKSSKIMES
ncbi:hypothetical protein A2U01_0095524, partial [Trifolium medium]|nr:hypothetical protein [Trifolium medium]